MNFIKEITIKNFFSIKNEVTLNLQASEYTKQQHPYRLFHCNNEYINKLTVLYGANASGKTTILKALVLVSHIISNKREDFPISHKNIYNSSRNTSFIEIVFVFENKEFTYKIDFLSEKHLIVGIKDEVLKIKNNNTYLILINRKQKIFKDFNNKQIDNILFDKVSTKKSLLVESITRISDYDNLLNFFSNIPFLTNIKGSHHVSMHLENEDNIMLASAFSDKEDTSLPFSEQILKIDKQKFYKFMFPILKELGIDIDIAKSNIDLNKTNNKDEFRIEVEFLITHSVNKNKKLDFHFESSGTKMLFKILFDIYYAYKTKSVLIIDELDSMLHPMIVPIINLLTIKNDIQLIYSTHNIHNMKYLYSDEIFLIKKDNNHITEIDNLTKDYKGYENFEKLYRNKQLGAIPKLENISLDMLVIDK